MNLHGVYAGPGTSIGEGEYVDSAACLFRSYVCIWRVSCSSITKRWSGSYEEEEGAVPSGISSPEEYGSGLLTLREWCGPGWARRHKVKFSAILIVEWTCLLQRVRPSSGLRRYDGRAHSADRGRGTMMSLQCFFTEMRRLIE